MHKHSKGIWAEKIAMLCYLFRGFWPLKSRFKAKTGEIDLILKRGNLLVFVEVKARARGMHEDIVLTSQQQRITRTAELFLAYNKRYQQCDLRFDLVVVKPYSWPEIIENAW